MIPQRHWQHPGKTLNVTTELLLSSSRFERLAIPDAEVYSLRHLPLSEPPESVLSRLIGEIPWRAEKISVWGKTFPQPRLIAWYGDASKNYTYSGICWTPLPWTPELLDIKGSVETATGTIFNSVLLNYYRDQRDSMGFHSDDERELGERPIIASVSLGAERTFILKHRTRKDLKPVRLRLGSGSLLLMTGATQCHWKHAVNKESRPCGPRVNLTFRQILT